MIKEMTDKMIVKMDGYRDRESFIMALVNSGYTTRVVEHVDHLYIRTYEVHFWKHK